MGQRYNESDRDYVKRQKNTTKPQPTKDTNIGSQSNPIIVGSEDDESESEDEKNFDPKLKKLNIQFSTLQQQILKIKDKKDPLRIKLLAELKELGIEMDN